MSGRCHTEDDIPLGLFNSPNLHKYSLFPKCTRYGVPNLSKWVGVCYWCLWHLRWKMMHLPDWCISHVIQISPIQEVQLGRWCDIASNCLKDKHFLKAVDSQTDLIYQDKIRKQVWPKTSWCLRQCPRSCLPYLLICQPLLLPFSNVALLLHLFWSSLPVQGVEGEGGTVDFLVLHFWHALPPTCKSCLLPLGQEAVGGGTAA